MAMTIKEAVILTARGRKISLNAVKDGFVVDVAGTVTKNKKNIFIRTRVIREEENFFLKDGQRVEIIPKTAIPA